MADSIKSQGLVHIKNKFSFSHTDLRKCESAFLKYFFSFLFLLFINFFLLITRVYIEEFKLWILFNYFIYFRKLYLKSKSLPTPNEQTYTNNPNFGRFYIHKIYVILHFLLNPSKEFKKRYWKQTTERRGRNKKIIFFLFEYFRYVKHLYQKEF